ncbi:hypothetical protein V6R21_02385 [Limibacter armeniacum]|uniref:hypothetical protein n=1 Tax=Limibacter armeniacum TaxID=466084 RepID=UPI002FE64656
MTKEKKQTTSISITKEAQKKFAEMQFEYVLAKRTKSNASDFLIFLLEKFEKDLKAGKIKPDTDNQ